MPVSSAVEKRATSPYSERDIKKLVTQLEKKRSDKHFSNLAADAIDEHDQCNSNWHEELEMLVEKFSDLGFSQDLSVLNQHQLFQLYLTLKRLRAENG